MIVVANDSDLRLVNAEQELRDVAGIPLAEVYPGYRWRIEAHPHPQWPFIDIQLEHGGHAMFGATVKPWQFYSASSLRAEVLKVGGELLECFHLNRRAFNEAEFLGRKKTFAGTILPDIAL